MILGRNSSMVLFLISAASVLVHCGCFGALQSREESSVGQYMEAVKRSDFRKVIDLTDFYQRKVDEIKAQNPSSLAPRLTDAFYKSQLDAFSKPANFWRDYGESFGGMVGDPIQQIRALQAVVLPTADWRITESRADGVVDLIPQGRFSRTRVYVSVSYTSPVSAPVVGTKLLRETLFEFTVNSETHLIVRIARLPQGDSFWEATPTTQLAIAKRLYDLSQWDEVIVELQPLYDRRKLQSEGIRVLASSYMGRIRSVCFTKGPIHLGGPHVLQFNRGNQCPDSVRLALSLDPNLKSEWMNLVLSAASSNIDAWELDSAASFLAMATETTIDDHQLNTTTAQLRQELSGRFLKRAIETYAHAGNGNTPFVQGEVAKASQLSPNLLSSTAALTVVKSCLQDAADDKARGDNFADMYFFGIPDFMKAYGIFVPPNELPILLRWAPYTSSALKWQQKMSERTTR